MINKAIKLKELSDKKQNKNNQNPTETEGNKLKALQSSTFVINKEDNTTFSRFKAELEDEQEDPVEKFYFEGSLEFQDNDEEDQEAQNSNPIDGENVAYEVLF